MPHCRPLRIRFEMNASTSINLLSLCTAVLCVSGSSPPPHGSNFPPAAWAAARAALALLNTSQKIDMVHGWGAPTNPGYAGFIPGHTVGATTLVPLSLEDGAQGVGNGLTDVTAFPSAMTMASAWDLDLACSYGEAIGAEQFSKGTNVALAPGLNLARIPWSGRVYEYLSGEDPFLGSKVRWQESSS